MTTEPPPFLKMLGTAACSVRTVPLMLVSIIKSSSSSVIVSIVLQRWIPALATTQSSSPYSATAAATAFSTSSRFRVFPSTKRAPVSRATACPSSTLMSMKVTFQPDCANLRTDAAPMPVEPPVMKTFFF